MKHTLYLALVLTLVVVVQGCGGSEDSQASSTKDPSGLSAHQLENGIGPVKSLDLGEIDAQLVAQGEEQFNVKCSACHRTGERYVGPALDDVLSRRTPAYVMNMILNPEEMIQKHPEARKLLGEFMTPMANQNLTEAEARAVLEYLRTQQTN